jgi:hypothetical protein
VSKVIALDRSVKPPAVGFTPEFPPHEDGRAQHRVGKTALRPTSRDPSDTPSPGGEGRGEGGLSPSALRISQTHATLPMSDTFCARLNARQVNSEKGISAGNDGIPRVPTTSPARRTNEAGELCRKGCRKRLSVAREYDQPRCVNAPAP